MSATITETLPAVIERKAAELEPLLTEQEFDKSMKYTLADAMREGCQVTGQSYGWTDGRENVCAMTGALVAIKARHLL